MSTFTVVVTNNAKNESHTFETDCAIFSAKATDSTDVHQSLLAHDVSAKDLTTVLSGCINSFLMAIDDPKSIELLDASVKAALMKLVQQKLFGA